jgi:hypothetical protein
MRLKLGSRGTECGALRRPSEVSASAASQQDRVKRSRVGPAARPFPRVCIVPARRPLLDALPHRNPNTSRGSGKAQDLRRSGRVVRGGTPFPSPRMTANGRAGRGRVFEWVSNRSPGVVSNGCRNTCQRASAPYNSSSGDSTSRKATSFESSDTLPKQSRIGSRLGLCCELRGSW